MKVSSRKDCVGLIAAVGIATTGSADPMSDDYNWPVVGAYALWPTRRYLLHRVSKDFVDNALS